jgi:hypothetical protein
MILLTLGLSLLPGCGRSDHPTVRQVSMHPGDESAAATAANPPQAPDECPQRKTPHIVRPKHAPPTHSRLADATRSKRAAVSPQSPAAPHPAQAAVVATPEAASQDTALVDSREVPLGGTCLVAPTTWTRQRPPIDSILAEFSLPRAKGDRSDAQLTVAAVPAGNPKSVDGLRERLKGQSGAGSVEQLQIGGNEVLLAENSGKYGDASDPFPSPVSEGRYRALTATVFSGGQVYFVNCTGPERTVAARTEEFRAFLQTMKPVN